MTEILKKLCQISGMLEMLACMQGCTITPEMSSLLDGCTSQNAGQLRSTHAEAWTGCCKDQVKGGIRMAILKQVVDLQETVKRLMEQNDRLRKERDAAVEDIRMLGRMGQNVCPVCAHYNHGEGDKQKCISCIMQWDTDNFEWRGAKKEEGASE